MGGFRTPTLLKNPTFSYIFCGTLKDFWQFPQEFLLAPNPSLRKPSQAAGNGALLLRLDAAAAPRSGGVDDAAGGFRCEGKGLRMAGGIHGPSSLEVVVPRHHFLDPKMVGFLFLV